MRLGDNDQNMLQPIDLSGCNPLLHGVSVRASRWLRPRLINLVVGFLILSIGAAKAQQNGGAAPAKPSTNPLSALIPAKPKAAVVEPELPAAFPEKPTAIPLPDVASRSMELSQMLRDASSKLPPPEQIDALKKSVNENEAVINSKIEEANRLLSGNPNSLEVREEENYWRGMAAFTASWQQQLLTWAKDAQAAVNAVAAQEPVWAVTLEENKSNNDLGPVLAVMENNLTELRRVRKQAQDVLESAVKLQIMVGTFDQTASTMVAELSEARTRLKGHLLDRDSLPLWKLSSRRQLGENAGIFHSLSSRMISIAYYLVEHEGAIIFLVVVMVASIATAKRLHGMVCDKQPTDELEAHAFFILRHWVAVGLLPPLILGYALAPSAPITLLGFIIMLSFFPILIILPPLLQERMRPLLYVFAGLYGFNWTIALLGLSPLVRRDLQFFSNVILFAILAYRVRPSSGLPRPKSWWPRVLWFGVRVAVATLGISLAADLFGYVKLSHFLAVAFIYSSFVAISVFTAVQVMTILLAVGLRSPLAESVAVVRLHREGLARWVPKALIWTGVLIWGMAALDLFGLQDGAQAALERFLDFKIAGSAGGITLGSLVSFFLILTVGYGIASAIRFLFREEILGRFHMSRGLPELIASIVYYSLLLVVALAAVNAAGIELNRFTVLTGAFGVGVGFGLQNIINNFVSGLILQFERPIHTDDILEVDTYIGRVTRIGIRSSTIRTFQGAEVIIPNANLISNKVINWTLSESERRRELPLGVAYGSDPKVVLKILRDAAGTHELVLTNPEPMAYFKGFGDSSLDFELHFWVIQENNWLQITSDVAMTAMKMLADAGIEIPFPQRDLHLRSVDAAAAAAFPSGGANKLNVRDESVYMAGRPELKATRKSEV
jgi:potassium-dependent mechanosensitive channel